MRSVDLPTIVQAGIDTVSFYLCLEGSPAIAKIGRLPGKPVAYKGTMLGEHASWGAWTHTFGYRAIWRPERKRLYLFPKLVAPNELCSIGEFESRIQHAIDKLAAVGVVSYMTPYVTRLDVAADGRFSSPQTARNFLHAVHGCRVPNGGRTGAAGDPIGTVYLMTRTGRDKTGRVYDKGREIQERSRREDAEGLPRPNELIRVESVHRFEPESVPVEAVAGMARDLWARRFLSLVPEHGQVQVIPFDRLRARIVQSVKDSRMKASQAERMRLFLELEATGEAEGFYGAKRYGQRRREARALGLRVEDAVRTEVDFDLAAILRSYAEANAWAAAGSGALAEAA